MTLSKLPGRRVSAILLVLTGLVALSAAAQAPRPGTAAPAKPAPADTTPPATRGGAPAALPPTEIPLAAPETQVRLLELDGLTVRDPAITSIEEQVGPLVDTLEAHAEAERATAVRHPTRRALLDVLLEWQRREAQISESQEVLRTHVAKLNEGRAQLDSLRSLWTRTLAEADPRSVPPEVREQARQIVVEAQRVDGRLRALQSSLLGIEVRLSNAHHLVNGREAEIQDALTQERRELFQLDTLPLWKSWPEPRVGLGEAVAGRWRENVEALRQFTGFYGGRLLVHGLGAMLLMALIVALRRGVRALPPGSAPLSAHETWLLENPFTASVLAALIATLPIYPRAPLIVYDIAVLLAAPALLLILPTVLPRELRRPAYLVSVVFLLYRLLWTSVGTTDWERHAEFLVEGGLLGVLLYGLGPRGSLAPLRASWSRLHTAIVLATAATAGAIVADVIGNVSLAHTIVIAILGLAALAVVLLATAEIANGILAIALHLGASQLRFVRVHGPAIENRVSQLVKLAAAGAWIVTALFATYLWDPVRHALVALLSARWEIGHASASLGAVLLFFLTVAAGVILGKWVALVLEMDLLDRLELPRGVAVTVASLVRYTLVAAAFFFALAAAGFEIGQLAIIGGALSVGVGFGLQTIVNNFISGLILAFERPIAVGDVVEVGTLLGEVREIGIRASVVRTPDGAEVIVPNGRLIAEPVINWTRTDQNRRIIIPVGVAYGTDPRRVIDLLRGAAARVSGVLPYPEPDVVFSGFGDSSLDFSVRVWTSVADWVAVNSELSMAISQELQDAGIEIPFPQRDLHLRSLAPEVAERLQGPDAAGRAV